MSHLGLVSDSGPVSHPAFAPASAAAIPVHLVGEDTWPIAAAALDPLARTFAEASGFTPRAGATCLLPGSDGRLSGVLFGIGGADRTGDPFICGQLATALPAGDYALVPEPKNPALAALAFALGRYGFSRYRECPGKAARLVLPAGVDGEEVGRIADAVAMGRDLINTPANDLGPEDRKSVV